ncbi:hypothetical protein MRS44_013892 [Fusarium solani]|uniref:uncharacterized protein n=1 Tax=Fusarium solani TaxID=169388 RepID=UPI0032C43E75|nr:hypothetical protein MRS44_013892 [Fusarium solani]
MNQPGSFPDPYPGYWGHDGLQSSTENGQQTRFRHQHHPPIPPGEERPGVGYVRDQTSVAPGLFGGKVPKRIGWWLRFVTFASFIVLFAAIVFLSWLWFEDHEYETWRRVMLSGMSTQAITLTGVLIRVAIGSLATITTSMIASIAVEGHGVPVPAVAEASIARFTNSGPQSLFMLLLSGETFKAYLRLLASILLLFTVASQFTSTLLVADLQQTRVSSFSQKISYGYNFQQMSTSIATPSPLIGFAYNYWLNKPSLSEIFAEYSQPGKSADGVDDTGPTIRAFIPIPIQSERENLRTFKGMARAFDARVACISPEFTARFCYNGGATFNWYVCGNLSIDAANLPTHVAGPLDDDGRFSLEFDCPIIDSPVEFPEQNWALCPAKPGYGLASSLSNATSLNNSTVFGSSWLLFDIGSIGSATPSGVKTIWQSNSTWAHLNSTKSGSWLRQWSRVTSEDGDTEVDYHLQMSWCFDALGGEVQNLNITASSPSNQTEPVFQWDVDSNLYDTLAVRRQLGATNPEERKSGPEREILTISASDMETSLEEIRGKPLVPPYQDGTTYYEWLHTQILLPGGQALAICPSCSPDQTSFQTVDNLLAQLFIDILNKTDSPALALQSLNTMALRMAYYDQIAAFTSTEDNATITRFDLVQTPQSAWGFIAVMAIIGCNILLFIIVCSLFLCITKFSLIGNAWHTVAQISQSAETHELLEYAVLATDKDVKDLVRGRTPPAGFKDQIWQFVKDYFHAGGSMRWILCLSEKSDEPQRLSVKHGLFAEVTPR